MTNVWWWKNWLYIRSAVSTQPTNPTDRRSRSASRGKKMKLLVQIMTLSSRTRHQQPASYCFKGTDIESLRFVSTIGSVPYPTLIRSDDQRASFILILNYPASSVAMATSQSAVRSGDIKEPVRAGRVLTAVSVVARDDTDQWWRITIMQERDRPIPRFFVHGGSRRANRGPKQPEPRNR